jgi:hypothetical protein
MPDPALTDDIIEAAARQRHEERRATHRLLGVEWPPYEELSEAGRADMRDQVRPFLTAVLPLLRAHIVDESRNERFFLAPNARGYECLWLRNEAAPHQPIELLSEFDFPAPSRTEAWRFVHDAVAARVARGGDQGG